LVTPEKGILKGITRKHTLEIARDVGGIELSDITIEEVQNAKEVFLTSSSQRIMPVVQVDDFMIGNGKPGIVTVELSKLLQAHIEKLMEKEVTY
jgi:branched-subunit amino acid aminotransferase/4-amino-4-deoxychorismate lyase